MGTSTYGSFGSSQQTLTLTPAQGDLKTTVTAQLSPGFGVCGEGNGTEASIPPVSLLWDGQPLATPASGSLVVNFTPKKNASAGEHQVTAQCGKNISATATFTLTAPDTPPKTPL